MKKVLTKAGVYMSPKGILFEKGKIYDMTPAQWADIPESAQSFFDDYKSPVQKVEESPKQENEVKKK